MRWVKEVSVAGFERRFHAGISASVEGVVAPLFVKGRKPGTVISPPVACGRETRSQHIVLREEVSTEGQILRSVVVTRKNPQVTREAACATKGLKQGGQMAACSRVAAATHEPEVAGDDELLSDGDDMVIRVARCVPNLEGLPSDLNPVTLAQPDVVLRGPPLRLRGGEHRTAECCHHLVVTGDVVGVAVGDENPNPRGVELPDRCDSYGGVNRVDQDGVSSMVKKVEEVVADGRREGQELQGDSDGLEGFDVEARVGRTAGLGIPWEERFEVERNYHGWRIDRYLAEKMHRASRAQAATITKHGLWLDDRWITKQGATVRAGQVIRIPRLEFADPATPSLDEVSVLHDDGAAIVLNKPPGMLIHRTANESTRTVEAYVSRQWPNDRVEAAHRLDRETAGCVACGRGFDAIRDLRMRFADSAAEKRYRAIVEDRGGLWQTGSRATIDTPLGMMGNSIVSIKMDVGPLPCRTHVVCVERRGDFALLEVEIEQGRQHQIRAHLWLQGTPIVGDKLYALGDRFFLAWINAPGAPELVEQLPIRWHALACIGLRFEHAGGSVAVTAPTPLHMASFWAGLQP